MHLVDKPVKETCTASLMHNQLWMFNSLHKLSSETYNEVVDNQHIKFELFPSRYLLRSGVM